MRRVVMGHEHDRALRLAVARLGFATLAHATASRAGWRRAALVVLGFYLASRCAMWWTLDLMRGHSFEGVLE